MAKQKIFLLKDLFANPRLFDEMKGGAMCALCGGPITHSDRCEGVERYNGKEAHADCYYGKLGELVEEAPPVSAGIRRS